MTRSGTVLRPWSPAMDTPRRCDKNLARRTALGDVGRPRGMPMRSAVAHRVFDSRSAVEVALCPQWDRLREQAFTWQRLDRAAGSPLARYGRYLEWAQSRTPFPDADLALAVAYFLPRYSSPPNADEWRALCDGASGITRPHPYDPALAWAAGWRPRRSPGPFIP